MTSKWSVFFAVVLLSMPSLAQVRPAAEAGQANFNIGGGIDYWYGDWSGVYRYGPAAWLTVPIWNGIGINVEGHSMIAGGGAPSPSYKYFVGEGGVIYTFSHFERFAPYAKAELGFASLSFPHRAGSTYTHDTRNTWAVGGGTEVKLSRHIWVRVDYTYDGFPNFYSPVTGNHRTLDPNGFSFGPTYHFR